MNEPQKMKTPTAAATEAGAEIDRIVLKQARQYPNIGRSAMGYDLDSDTPQQVMAYVSRGFIYQVDDTLTVVAYGRLTRCGVRS
jgi:hypothetical protein